MCAGRPPSRIWRPSSVRPRHEIVFKPFDVLGPKRVAVHNRSWGVGEPVLDLSHEQGLLEHKPRAAVGALPLELRGLGETAASYFKILAANGRSLRKEIERLVLLSELFGDSSTRSAVEDVMATGHVGAEYVEYVLRHKKGLSPTHTPLRLGNYELDGIRLGEPDLTRCLPETASARKCLSRSVVRR